MITSVSKNKKMLGLKYYDGSTDTAVAIHNVRTKYTSFGVSWPHITANNLFGHEYEDLEQCMRHEKKFSKTVTEPYFPKVSERNFVEEFDHRNRANSTPRLERRPSLDGST